MKPIRYAITLIAGVLLANPFPTHAQGFWGGFAQGMIEGDKAKDRRKALELEQERLRILQEQQRMETERIQHEQQVAEQKRLAEIAAIEEAKRQEKRARIEAYKQGHTGTGFFVSRNGHIITNAHVVGDYPFVIAKDSTGKIYELDVLAIDKQNDLALLQAAKKSEGLPLMSLQTVGKGLRVYAIGYPQPGIQGTESKITDGIISSMTGLRNDNSSYQISVPIQAGNSGGPLVTETGAVVGVVVATVNAKRFFAATGDIPQNVNFAIKPDILAGFMKANNVIPLRAGKAKANSLGFANENTVIIAARPERFDVASIPPPSGRVPQISSRPPGGESIRMAIPPERKSEPLHSRYVDYEDGTILDTHTRLRWQRCAIGQSWDGGTCNGVPSEMTWDEAVKLTGDYAGISDWRLPVKDELKTLVECVPSERRVVLPDRQRCSEYSQTARINPIAFPNVQKESVFWTRDLAEKQSPHLQPEVWVISFSDGAAYDIHPRGHKGNVRLVTLSLDKKKHVSEVTSTQEPGVLEDVGMEWAWPADGHIVARFDENDGTRGIDIAGRLGDSVRAAGAGKVIYAGNRVKGYGNLVMIRHSDSILTAYAHNSRILVSEGEAVILGQKIAEIGGSTARQPKLHFEIRVKGTPVDPLRFLPSKEVTQLK